MGRQIVVMPLKLGYYTETQYRQLTNSAKPYQRSIKIVIPASTCKCVCSMLLTPPISLSFSLVCDINSACVRNHINRLARGTPTCNEMLMESRYLNVHEQQLFFRCLERYQCLSGRGKKRAKWKFNVVYFIARTLLMDFKSISIIIVTCISDAIIQFCGHCKYNKI